MLVLSLPFFTVITMHLLLYLLSFYIFLWPFIVYRPTFRKRPTFAFINAPIALSIVSWTAISPIASPYTTGLLSRATLVSSIASAPFGAPKTNLQHIPVIVSSLRFESLESLLIATDEDVSPVYFYTCVLYLLIRTQCF